MDGQKTDERRCIEASYTGAVNALDRSPDLLDRTAHGLLVAGLLFAESRGAWTR